MERIELQCTGQKIFFTSDMHFGHRNILSFCDRIKTFADVKSMNEGMIERWNSVIGENDIVFDCGDFSWFPGVHEYGKLLKKFNGIHYIIPGNHDDVAKLKAAVIKYNLQDKVHICAEVVHLHLHDFEDQINMEDVIVLCHYPLLTWSGSNRRSIHLFGHIHSLSIDQMKEFGIGMQFRKNMLDVGVDSHDYTPVSLARVYSELRSLGLNTEDKQWGMQL
uniref:Metallophosphatase domain protein n=1 Tax=Phage sp. ctL4h4 TaxID=2828005 RepID=A0A8S5TG75_9VIRU|nr:MAG TPA: metallophosphatase domain protein [Phage sp. ctL4h4]